jgi:transcriptional regulator with XRE-family HTH domain
MGPRRSASASNSDTLVLMETHESEAVQLAEEESARLMGLLSRLVRLSKRSMRSLEAELGLGSSVVSKILAGVIRPQLSYVLMIAAAVGVKPEEFFSLAYRLKKRPTNSLVKELMEAEGAAVAEEQETRVNQEQLDQQVDAAVRRALQRIGTETGGPKRQAD